jgi:hypothetical protein
MYCLMVMFFHVILWIHYYSWYIVLNFVNSIKQELGGRHGRDRMVVRTTTTYAINAYHNWCCEFESWSERGVQHYVINFVSDLRQLGGFLRVLRFPPPIKLTPRYNWNIVESGIKHHQTNIKQELIIPAPTKLRGDIVTLPSVLPSVRHNPCEHSRINILQWILTKLGTYLVLKRIWNHIDFQGQRSRSRSNFYCITSLWTL